jgi:hypothetical protein
MEYIDKFKYESLFPIYYIIIQIIIIIITNIINGRPKTHKILTVLSSWPQGSILTQIKPCPCQPQQHPEPPQNW